MSENFTYQGSPATIIFGSGASGKVGEWVEKLGHSRAVVLSTPHQETDARALAEKLGALAAGVYSGAVMHTPTDATDKAVDYVKSLSADCVIALGGGSTTGLGKAISWRTGLTQIVIPTTYAGSEVTPILGETRDGLKTTFKDRKILPGVVIYDPDLMLGLPVAMSVTSGLNAIAHAAEALYSVDRNPVSSLMATEGMRALAKALPVIVRDPRNADARSDALYGAWLCGTVLGTVGMALHHKICHTLGGSFNMPHAETHAVMLPHTIGFNAQAVPELTHPIAQIFDDSPGRALYDFAQSVGAPMSLKELGFAEADLDRATEIAAGSPYPNPRPFDRASIAALLRQAWNGDRPDY
jgi:maleylacetate reductase